MCSEFVVNNQVVVLRIMLSNFSCALHHLVQVDVAMVLLHALACYFTTSTFTVQKHTNSNLLVMISA